MKKVLKTYVACMGIILVLLFWFDSWYLAALFVLMGIFPLILRVILRWDTKNLKVEMDIRHSCRMGTSAPISLALKRKHMPFALGEVVVTLEWVNEMLGEKRVQKMSYPLLRKEQEIPIDIAFSCCGEIAVSYIQVQGYDVFGLCSRTFFYEENMRILVFPMEVDMRVYYEQKKAGDEEDAWESLANKGKDASEVYDLRQYQPGDSIHSIHWKMSGKWDELVVKEPGDTLHTDALFLLDVGKQMDSVDMVLHPLLSAAVSFAQACCRNLSENGVKFIAAYASDRQLFTNPVMTQDVLPDLFCTWLEVPIPDKNGTILKFWRQQETKVFSRVIYVTAGRFPDNLFPAKQSTGQITAICITEEGEQIRAMEQNNVHMVEVPMAVLQDKENVIRI